MADQTVLVETDSKARVAFDLMHRIMHNEGMEITKESVTEVYAHCWKLAHGHTVD